ncbi:MAG TPA: rhodanese-like domain-containing protein [Anaerolineales bacterium]|nr:rhodanese-like domain-containing protein [Anaerolineales bacterium]
MNKNQKPRSRSVPLLLMVVGLVLVIIAIFFSLNLPKTAPVPDASAQPGTAAIPHPDVPRVSLADARAAYDIGSAVFVDVRGEPYFTQGHIQGALSVNEADLDAGIAALDPQAWIITYCT